MALRALEFCDVEMGSSRRRKQEKLVFDNDLIKFLALEMCTCKPRGVCPMCILYGSIKQVYTQECWRYHGGRMMKEKARENFQFANFKLIGLCTLNFIANMYA